MRGAPQSGFSMLIRRISARRSASICGRPPNDRDFQRQIEMHKPPSRYGSYLVTADTSGHPSGEWLSTALKSTAPYGRCTSCGTYHRSASLPIGTMYSQGVRYTIGWANIQALMPKVLDLLAQRKVPVERIHSVARWDDAIEAMEMPPVKLILAREDA
jgi:alcohol dehydrogenase